MRMQSTTREKKNWTVSLHKIPMFLWLVLTWMALTADATTTPDDGRNPRQSTISPIRSVDQNTHALIAKNLESILDQHQLDFTFASSNDRARFVHDLSAEMVDVTRNALIQSTPELTKLAHLIQSERFTTHRKQNLMEGFLDKNNAVVHQDLERSFPQLIQNFFLKNVKTVSLNKGTTALSKRSVPQRWIKIILVSARTLGAAILSLIMLITGSIWLLLTTIWILLVKAFVALLPPQLGTFLGKWQLKQCLNRYNEAHSAEQKANIRESASALLSALIHSDDRFSKWYFNGFQELGEEDQETVSKIMSYSKEFTEFLGHGRKLVDVFQFDLDMNLSSKERRVILKKWALIVAEQNENSQLVLVHDLAKALFQSGLNDPSFRPQVTVIISEFEEALQLVDGDCLNRFRGDLDLVMFEDMVDKIANSIHEMSPEAIQSRMEEIVGMIAARESESKYMEVFIRKIFLSLLTQPSQEHADFVATNLLTYVKTQPNTQLTSVFLDELGRFMSNTEYGTRLYSKIIKKVFNLPLERSPSMPTILENHAVL